jgi:hypothetical protein
MSKVIKKVAGIGGTLASAATGNPAWAMAGNAIAGIGSKAGQSSASKATTGPTMPAWLDTAWQDLYSSSKTQFQKPYEQYTGTRVAPLSTDEQNAFTQLRGLIGQQNPFFTQAKGTMQDVINRSLNGPNQSQLEALMNPYQQNVIDVNKLETLRDYDTQRNAMNTQAANAGAFGGSRQYIQNTMADRNLKDLLSKMQVEGMQRSWDQAQNLFQQGTQNAGQGALSLAGLANQQQQSNLTDLSALEGIGSKQRGIEQQGYDVTYQDWLTKQNWQNTQNSQLAEMLKNISPNYTGAMQNTTNYGAKPATDTALAGLGSIVGGLFGNNNNNSGGIFGGGSGNYGNLGKIDWYPSGGVFGGGSGNYGNLGTINWFAKGGGIPDVMESEQNDLYSKNVKEDNRSSPEDAQPYTKEDMMKYEENDLYSKNITEEPEAGLEKYMCGGSVKKYAEGGGIMGWLRNNLPEYMLPDSSRVDYSRGSPYSKPWASGVKIDTSPIEKLFFNSPSGSAIRGLAGIAALANAKHQMEQPLDPQAEFQTSVKNLSKPSDVTGDLNKQVPVGEDAMRLQLPVRGQGPNFVGPMPPMDIPAGSIPQIPQNNQQQQQAPQDMLQALIDRLSGKVAKGVDRPMTREEEFASNPLIAMGMKMLGSTGNVHAAMSEGYEAYQGAVKGKQASEDQQLQSLLEMMKAQTAMKNAESSDMYRQAMAERAMADTNWIIRGKNAPTAVMNKISALAAKYRESVESSVEYLMAPPEKKQQMLLEAEAQASKTVLQAQAEAEAATGSGTGVSGAGSSIANSNPEAITASIKRNLDKGRSEKQIKDALEAKGITDPDKYWPKD